MIFNETPTLRENVVTLNLPATSEYVSVARLTVSGMATRLNFSVEDIEDIKIAVSEACTNAVQHAYEDTKKVGRIELTLTLYEDQIEISVKDFGTGFNVGMLGSDEQKKRSEEKLGLGLGLTFIKNLMDEVEIKTTPQEGTTIRMSKLRPIDTNMTAAPLKTNQSAD